MSDATVESLENQTASETKLRSTLTNVYGAGLVFASFALIYVLLRSGDIFAVDGAHRCLQVYRRQSIFFHGSNHMLYPVYVLLWTRLTAALGLKSQTPLAFFSTVELMNCVAAAACLAIVFFLMLRVGRNWRVAVGVTAALGFSKAWFEQATNANEPVVGLLWSLTAVLIAAFASGKELIFGLFVSGALFALSMASYQSMVFLAPVAVVLAWRAGSSRAGREYWRSFRDGAKRVGILTTGGLAAGIAIYASAFWMMGTRQPQSVVRQVMRIDGQQTWFGLSLGKMLNVPIGAIQSVFPILIDYRGIRSLLRGPKIQLVGCLLIMVFFFGFVAFCVAEIWQHRRDLSSEQRAAVVAVTAGLVSTMIPVCVFAPNYDKLWLQPLACLAILVGIALSASWYRTATSRLVRVLAALLLAGVLTNFVWAIPSHSVNESAMFDEAQQLTTIVGTNDVVIGEWNRVAMLYGDLWGSHYIDFASEASQEGQGAVGVIRKATVDAQQRGGRVYFLGLLDLSKQTWDGFLGSRCGVQYSELNEYRVHSHAIAIFHDRTTEVVLRRLDLSVPEYTAQTGAGFSRYGWVDGHHILAVPQGSFE